MTGWMRALTPLGWAIVVALAVGGLVFLATTTGWRWDPLDLQRRRLEAATARLERVETEVEALRRLSAAEAEQAARLETHHQVVLDVTRVTAAAAAQARTAHDADQLLEPGRMARLHAHDDELCRAALGVCAARSAEPARDGDAAL